MTAVVGLVMGGRSRVRIDGREAGLEWRGCGFVFLDDLDPSAFVRAAALDFFGSALREIHVY